MQRVQREITGYYCGYTFKGQTVGKKMLLKASGTLDYLTPTLAKKTATQRMHQITNRVFMDIHHRCAARPANEEWNLAAFWHAEDVTNAEFIRTYRSATFPGGQLVQRLEDELVRKPQRMQRKGLPTRRYETKDPTTENVVLQHFPDLYGYRGEHPAVFYLNPWEFAMLWEIRRLTNSRIHGKISCTVGTGDAVDVNPAAEEYYHEIGTVLFYPKEAGVLRKTWLMVRRRKPIVPAPSNMPMPDKYASPQKRGKLYSVYMRRVGAQSYLMDFSLLTVLARCST